MSLQDYRAKRDPVRTPEPVPDRGATAGRDADPPGPAGGGTFVIQEHHTVNRARRLHWDFRLERDGVLVSWAVPKNLPLDPATNHLAVHTEDHPLEYAAFAGDIPKGEYGGGSVTIWDRGSYDAEKWTESEVKVVLRGGRISGRYVLFRTDGRNWMAHRMDAAPDPDRASLPARVAPMLATPGELPADDAAYGYEFKWDGVRAVVYVEGGRARAHSRNDRDVTASYPEVAQVAEALGSRQVVLDGEIVAMDERGRPSFEALQPRMHLTRARDVARARDQAPASYLVFDVLHLDGHDTTGLPYTERRRLLDGLALAGPCWASPPSFTGGGAAVLAASRDQGLEGVVAKRLDSPYRPGRRAAEWVKVKHARSQSVVVAGWKPGERRRAGTIGSLLLGVYGEHGLVYAGHVGTGFSDRVLADLHRRLRELERPAPAFDVPPPREHAKAAQWVEPLLVGEVAFAEWTRDGRLRQPSWRGLRADVDPRQVRREP